MGGGRFLLPEMSSALTILSVGYPLLPVSSGAAGGAEQILYLMERLLVRNGHRSIVVAAAGSEVSGHLAETPPAPNEITEEARREAQQKHLLAIDQVLETRDIDLIHFHGLDFHAYIPHHQVPKLATLHLPLAWYPPSIFDLPGVQLSCVSASQAASAPAPYRTLPVVRNGVDVDAYRWDSEKRDFLLWIGRICPEKGVHIALRVAHRLDRPLVVAGAVHPFREHRTYFHREVEPLLDSKRTYIGPANRAQKVDLLAQASCLLVPSLVAETSSLVAMEALSSGTPVVAFRSGALPEVIRDNETGFITETEEDMARAVTRISEISPAVCRAAAETHFRSERMFSEYLALYHETISSLHRIPVL